MKRTVVAASLLVACAAFLAGQTRARPPDRPVLGAVIAPFPTGPAKDVADAACLKCHGTDIVRQQKLTEKQWAANVTKMVGWGAELPENRKDELVRYLAANFGPGNSSFRPVVVRPNRTR